MLPYKSLPYISLCHHKVQTISPLYFYKVWALMGRIIVGTQQPSRYTFHPIFPRWLGSVLSLFLKRSTEFTQNAQVFLKCKRTIYNYTMFFLKTFF